MKNSCIIFPFKRFFLYGGWRAPWKHGRLWMDPDIEQKALLRKVFIFHYICLEYLNSQESNCFAQ